MPPGFAYAEGSARIGGVAVEPQQTGRELIWQNLTIAADATVRIDFILIVGAGVRDGTHINRAFARDAATGAVVSDIAEAAVIVTPDHLLGCGEIIGKVFEDENRNGYQDAGEAGLPGVRIATAKGLLVTTDRHGRFHVTCASIPDADIGSNFIMKLDTRSLPTGYRITTENPRVVRLTRGKITKLNFGAAITRVVRVDLKGGAFKKNSAELRPDWASGVDRLVAVLDQEPSTLRLTYYFGREGKSIASRRVSAVERLIRDTWARRRGRYQLPIEIRLISLSRRGER
jgi:hypothetical protein